MSDVGNTPPGESAPDPVGMPPAPDEFATTVLPTAVPDAPAAYPPPAYPPPGGAAYPTAAYPQQPYPGQAYPQQPYPQQTYPQQTYPQQSYPPPAAYPPPASYQGQQPSYPQQGASYPSQQPYPGQQPYASQQPWPGQQPYGYAAPGYPAPTATTVAPSNVSAAVLLIISIIAIIATGIIGPPSGVMAVMSLARNKSEPERAARTATRGWITFAINAVIGLFVLVWFLWWLGNRNR